MCIVCCAQLCVIVTITVTFLVTVIVAISDTVCACMLVYFKNQCEVECACL